MSGMAVVAVKVVGVVDPYLLHPLNTSLVYFIEGSIHFSMILVERDSVV